MARRSRLHLGWKETPVERERWLRDRQPSTGQAHPGILLQMCLDAPFATWGGVELAPGSSGMHLPLAAVGRPPPGDWAGLLQPLREEVAAAGWQLVGQDLLAKPLPGDMEFESLLAEPPYRVIDVLFCAID